MIRKKKPVAAKTTNKKSIIFLIAMFFILSIIGGIYLFSHNLDELGYKAPTTTEQQISVAMSKNSNIAAIQIVSVNLEKNTRKLHYMGMTDARVKRAYDLLLANRISPEVPIFTDNPVNNTRIIKLINHEYVCSSFKDTITYKFAVGIEDLITTVCAMAIPPSFGQFKGIVGIFLYNEPTEYEKDALRNVIKELADLANNELN